YVLSIKVNEMLQKVTLLGA
ncbi:hypothetical protein BMETH_22873694281749, partial [methanotrophic bacterial endosymbiont of Bathymodiolus sp.]